MLQHVTGFQESKWGHLEDTVGKQSRMQHTLLLLLAAGGGLLPGIAVALLGLRSRSLAGHVRGAGSRAAVPVLSGGRRGGRGLPYPRHPRQLPALGPSIQLQEKSLSVSELSKIHGQNLCLPEFLW